VLFGENVFVTSNRLNLSAPIRILQHKSFCRRRGITPQDANAKGVEGIIGQRHHFSAMSSIMTSVVSNAPSSSIIEASHVTLPGLEALELAALHFKLNDAEAHLFTLA
jgi:hypothetical protein